MNQFYKLSKAEVIIQNGVFYTSYYPFKEFKSNDTPRWWRAYNKVKHEWFNSLSEHGTLINVVEALGSLFLLNVLHKDCQRWLVYNGVIKGVRGERRQYDHMGEPYGRLLALLEKSRSGIYINQIGNLDCWANSRLFEHTFRNVKVIDLEFY